MFYEPVLFVQEPVLFDRSIAENIMYGDNSRDVSMEEVRDDNDDKYFDNYNADHFR